MVKIGPSLEQIIKKRLLGQLQTPPVDLNKPLSYGQEQDIRIKIIDEREIPRKSLKKVTKSTDKHDDKGPDKKTKNTEKIGPPDDAEGKADRIAKDAHEDDINLSDPKNQNKIAPKSKKDTKGPPGQQQPGMGPSKQLGLQAPEVKGDETGNLAPIRIVPNSDIDNPNEVSFGKITPVDVRPTFKTNVSPSDREDSRPVREETKRSKKELYNAQVHHAGKAREALDSAKTHTHQGFDKVTRGQESFAKLHSSAISGLQRKAQLHIKAAKVAKKMFRRPYLEDESLPKLDTKAAAGFWRPQVLHKQGVKLLIRKNRKLKEDDMQLNELGRPTLLSFAKKQRDRANANDKYGNPSQQLSVSTDKRRALAAKAEQKASKIKEQAGLDMPLYNDLNDHGNIDGVLGRQPRKRKLRKEDLVINAIRGALFRIDEQASEDVIISINGYDFLIEIASTPEEITQGLMWREELPLNQGMLFDFGHDKMLDMWMHETYVPLDMLFIDSYGTIQHIAPNCITESDDYISSEVPVRFVLEINAGLCDDIGIEEGDSIKKKINEGIKTAILAGHAIKRAKQGVSNIASKTKKTGSAIASSASNLYKRGKLAYLQHKLKKSTAKAAKVAASSKPKAKTSSKSSSAPKSAPKKKTAAPPPSGFKKRVKVKSTSTSPSTGTVVHHIYHHSSSGVIPKPKKRSLLGRIGKSAINYGTNFLSHELFGHTRRRRRRHSFWD